MQALSTIWKGLDWSVLTDILLSVIPALLCITLHELSHGYVACLLGDDTAKNSGRLTLNPIKHIDVMGVLMMIVFKFGWAKPVPVNMYRFKNPKRGMALTALAGPVSNVLLTCVLLFIYGILYIPIIKLYTVRPGLAEALEQTFISAAYLSIGLAIFNVIPVPPLDGSKVLFSIIPERWYEKLMRYERYGMILLLVLVAADVFSAPLSAVRGLLFDKLFIFAEWGFELGGKIFQVI